MTKEKLLENGFTLAKITSAMKRAEKLINYYNKKYNFDITLGSEKEQKQYNSTLNLWDTFKSHRDLLKS